jgi:transposase-like protein
MTVKSTYSAAFKEQALSKVLSRGNRTVKSVADELNISIFTLKNWITKMVRKDAKVELQKERRPQDWSLREQLMALHESHGLQDEALNAWCREKGLFAHHLTSWREAFCAGTKAEPEGERERRLLKDENQQLKRQLVRKEKALAEVAALLVLQKKFQALWEDEVK